MLQQHNNTKDYINTHGLSCAAILSQVQRALSQFRVNYVNLDRIHRVDPDGVPIEKTMEVLHDIIKTGKMRYIGASSMHAVDRTTMIRFFAEKHGWTKFVSMRNNYKLLYRDEER